MRAATFITTLSLLSPFVSGHAGPDAYPVPRIFGRNLNHIERTAGPLPAPKPLRIRANIKERQASDPDTCGPGVGSCAAGKCCSPEGYCGTTTDFCAAPDCQIDYGPGCDANQTPPGTTTSTVARTKVGSVLYGGAGIYSCTKPGTVAITFDDGPYSYTKNVLDLFDAYNAKATFFITGNNLGKGPIDDPSYPWRALIERMDSSGHQIASHSWSHQDLSAITNAQLQAQIYKLEMATRNILGKFPTYMRPPYSSCSTACRNFLASAGYHIIYFDLDTSDYLFTTPDLIQRSKDYITTNLTAKGDPKVDDWLTIAHDIHPQTANNLTEFMLQSFTAKGFKLVTVGECLGDPAANWYRAAGGAGVYSTRSSSATASSTVSSAPVSSPTGVSKDGTCGSQGAGTCLGSEFGNCCSPVGWCGATDAYCGNGCQIGFGNCGSNNPSGASSIVSATSSTPAQPTQSLSTSLDSTCGSNTAHTCLGFAQGTCCSRYGYCGNTDGHCGDGCQSAYGTCGGSSSSAGAASSQGFSSSAAVQSSIKSSSAAILSSVKSSSVAVSSSVRTVSSSVKPASSSVKPASSSIRPSSSILVSSSVRPSSSVAASPTPSVSTAGRCGAVNNQTCANSKYGTCCIQFSTSTAGYCYSGSTCKLFASYCQSKFGTC